jgi:hypothetical protein
MTPRWPLRGSIQVRCGSRLAWRTPADLIADAHQALDALR